MRRLGGRSWSGRGRGGWGRSSSSVARVVHEGLGKGRGLGGGRDRSRSAEGRKARALREWKIITADFGWRAAAWLLLLVDNLMQAAMLKHDALPGLNTVYASIEDAGDQDIRRVAAWVIHAGVAPLAEANLDAGVAGTANEDSEIRGENRVGIATGGEIGFDRAMIHSHHEAWSLARGNARIRSEFDGSRSADLERTPLRKRDLSRGCAGRDGSAGRNESGAVHHLQRAGDHGCAAGDTTIQRNDRD